MALLRQFQAETVDISLCGPGQVCSINDRGVPGRLTERPLHGTAALIMMLGTTQTLGVVSKVFYIIFCHFITKKTN